MKIAIGADHAGFKKKQKLVSFLTRKKHEVIDLGTTSTQSTDYPVYAFEVAELVSKGEADFGILICKTGIGMSIAANKVKNVRCAKVDNTKETKLAKEHNHANVLAFSSLSHSALQMKDMVEVYLKASYSTEERHAKRVSLIDKYGIKETVKKEKLKTTEKETKNKVKEPAKKTVQKASVKKEVVPKTKSTKQVKKETSKKKTNKNA